MTKRAIVFDGDCCRTVMTKLIVEVDIHLERMKTAPNDAIKFSEHAQTLGLLRAIDIVKEHI